MTTLTVGANKQFTTISAAVAAARDGDTVAVAAGTYVNDFATIHSRITLVAVGGPVTMLSTSTAAIAKALLTVTTDATVVGFTFSGLRTADGTGAGLLFQGGHLVVENSLFTGNQTGLLATASAAGAITIMASEFARNGNGDGFSHSIAVGSIAALTILDSYLHDAVGGDEVRSLAATTTITGTRIGDNTGTATLAVDLPNGGTVLLQGNTIEKGALSTATAAIRFGGGTVQPGSTLQLTGNTVVNDKPGAVLLQNQATSIASVVSNTVWGFSALATGPAALFANIVAANRPTVATTALIEALATPLEFGRAGAVVASGHTLTVGVAEQYATVAEALAASVDGDTIDVAAGTYVNDTAIVSHRVIIEGVGGLARFVDTTTPTNGLAQFVTLTDVTFRNVEIFGATSLGGVAAAILSQGGNLTITNSTIHDNQTGVVAEAAMTGAAGSVGIYDTEIARNGTADGRGADVSVAAISTLTLRNDYVHDAIAGPEIFSLAGNTVVDTTRISQAAGTGGAAVALPNGGLVSISNSAIEKGANSQVVPLVQIGGGTVQAGSAVALANNTLISALTTAPTTFVSNTATTVSVAVSGTTYVGGTGGSVPVIGGTNSAAKVATGVSVNTASPWGATVAPIAVAPTVVAPSGSAVPLPGQLILYVSEAAWQGDAQFSLTVDGAAVAGALRSTASHAAGQTQSVTIAGPFAPGAHTVSVAFTNSLDSGANGRALYVDGMLFNGQDMGQSAALLANGTALLSTAATTTKAAVTINLSEDAWHGDALAFISIDGKVEGGVQTVTASHAAGSTQGMSFLLDLAPGAHTASVTLLNGTAAGRALYVGSIDVAGQHYAAAAAVLGGSQGAGETSNFAFTVAPPVAANGALFVTVGQALDLTAVLPH